ncbi:MAG: PLP-dependent aminotransferase family protein [Clostridia bacterium]|nr:PLP-dependent aminotransferase family protein [Clostridia bacterium]
MKSEKKYYSLYKSVKEKILTREYQSGVKLPSKRTMADMTGYSTVTVENAYDRLIDEGYIYSLERSGYYVTDIGGIYPKERISKPILPHLSEEESQLSDDFESSVWFRTVRKVMSEKGDSLFVKSPSMGCAVLRNAISDYLYRYRGMFAEPERIIIGSGSEQLYDTAVRILGRDKIYAIEDPSYSQIETVYSGMGVALERLKMGKNGIESSALRSSAANVLHVTPFHSYPSGVTASLKKRHEYISWAGEGDRYIIEDDFDSEFFMPGHPVDPLYSIDAKGYVIYINTFSKSLSPSMRMGYMILPWALLDVYREKLGAYSCTVPVFEQYVLAEFISSGNFERHLNRVRRRIRNEKNKFS